MARTRQRDNGRERALRSLLHAAGLRFRVHYALLPGSRRTVDIAFTARRIAVLLDGCFWHGCPLHGTRPSRNAAWWAAKLDANVRRDRDTDLRLAEAGWSVVRIWEHETLEDAFMRIASAVASSRHVDRRLAARRRVRPDPSLRSSPPRPA